jgi:hypothetical protein
MRFTVTGLFQDLTAAEAVIHELIRHEFDPREIGVIANGVVPRSIDGVSVHSLDEAQDPVPLTESGAVLGGFTGLLIGLGALALPGFGPLFAAGTWAAALSGAGLGALTGGLMGALVEFGFAEHEAEEFAEGIESGKVLVSVTTDRVQIAEARALLERFGGAVPGATNDIVSGRSESSEDIDQMRNTVLAESAESADEMSISVTEGPNTVAYEQRVRELAYYYWENEGRPEGRAMEHWKRAERVLRPPEQVASRDTSGERVIHLARQVEKESMGSVEEAPKKAPRKKASKEVRPSK